VRRRTVVCEDLAPPTTLQRIDRQARKPPARNQFSIDSNRCPPSIAARANEIECESRQTLRQVVINIDETRG
jgi:hypothetical protein